LRKIIGKMPMPRLANVLRFVLLTVFFWHEHGYIDHSIAEKPKEKFGQSCRSSEKNGI
jgi:hypothetical protein